MLNRGLYCILVACLKESFVVLVATVAVDADVAEGFILCINVRGNRLLLVLLELIGQIMVSTWLLSLRWTMGLLHWYEVVRLRASVSQRLRSLPLHAPTSAMALRGASALLDELHFKFPADDASNLVFFYRLLHPFKQLLFTVVEFTSFVDQNSCLIAGVALG